MKIKNRAQIELDKVLEQLKKDGKIPAPAKKKSKKKSK
jgi:hypothetical protein